MKRGCHTALTGPRHLHLLIDEVLSSELVSPVGVHFVILHFQLPPSPPHSIEPFIMKAEFLLGFFFALLTSRAQSQALSRYRDPRAHHARQINVDLPYVCSYVYKVGVLTGTCQIEITDEWGFCKDEECIIPRTCIDSNNDNVLPPGTVPLATLT